MTAEDDATKKKTIKSQIEQQEQDSTASRDATTASRKELDDIDAKLQSIQDKLDEIKVKQGSERATIASKRKLDQKVLKDFKDKQDRKKSDDKKPTDEK